jgi:hypothetical protein
MAVAGCAESKWRALDIECPVCKVDHDQPCIDTSGTYRAPHVDRARSNRWAKMGIGG